MSSVSNPAALLDLTTPAGVASRSATAPRDRERPFGIEELFFSTTDPKGIIRSGNEVFTRISGYAAEQLAGSPHNIIRHPDMPRAVFKLLWDEIQAGRPIAAYVKNLAADGAHYWVMATVVPAAGGYLSVRLKPSTPFFDAARSIYAQMLERERQVEAGQPRRRGEAMQASTALLGDLLREAGFASYQAFMQVALPAEVMLREQVLGAPTGAEHDDDGSAGDQRLAGVLNACATVRGFLDRLSGKLDQHRALNDSLGRKARFVLDLSEDVGLFSLNALLTATRVGGDGATLGAVAGIMRSRSDASAPTFRELTDELGAVLALLGEMFFAVATIRLQIEVTMVFVRELRAGGDQRRAVADLTVLSRCLEDGVHTLLASLTGVNERVTALNLHVDRLKADLSVLRALEVNGRIEATRLDQADGVVALFSTIGEQIRAARRELDELSAMRGRAFGLTAAESERIRRLVGDIGREVAALETA